MNRYFEHIKLKCANIDPWCDMAKDGVKQILMATAVGCVEGKEGKKWAAG